MIAVILKPGFHSHRVESRNTSFRAIQICSDYKHDPRGPGRLYMENSRDDCKPLKRPRPDPFRLDKIKFYSGDPKSSKDNRKETGTTIWKLLDTTQTDQNHQKQVVSSWRAIPEVAISFYVCILMTQHHLLVSIYCFSQHLMSET